MVELAPVRSRIGESMERLTTNKSVADMSMIELAHNSAMPDTEITIWKWMHEILPETSWPH